MSASRSQPPRRLPLDGIDERRAAQTGDMAGPSAAADLRTAEAGITDASAYLATAEHIHQLRATEQRRADRPATPTHPQAQRSPDGKPAR